MLMFVAVVRGMFV